MRRYVIFIVGKAMKKILTFLLIAIMLMPFIASEPTLAADYTSDEIWCAKMARREAGTNRAGSEAVISVVANRLNDSRFKYKSIEEVLFAPNQFSTAAKLESTTPSAVNLEAAKKVLRTGSVLPKGVLFFKSGSQTWGTRVFYKNVGGNNFFFYGQKDYDNWVNSGGGTPTPKPTASKTPKPKPTFATLAVGSNGDKVKTIQTVLSRLGYKVSTDGKFGESTQTAVKDLQDKHGLKVDGKVGKVTWDLIVDYQNAKYVPESFPLKQGMEGSKVKEVQNLLSELEYEVATDGKFGSGTQTAVRDFQQDFELTVDGTVGQGTLDALKNAKKLLSEPADIELTPEPPPTPSAVVVVANVPLPEIEIVSDPEPAPNTWWLWVVIPVILAAGIYCWFRFYNVGGKLAFSTVFSYSTWGKLKRMPSHILRKSTFSKKSRRRNW